MIDWLDYTEYMYGRRRDDSIHQGVVEKGVFHIYHPAVCGGNCEYTKALETGLGQKFGQYAYYDLRIENGKLVGDW